MSDMGSQARETMRIRFGPASVPAPPPPIIMADLCVGKDSLDSIYKHSTAFMHAARIPLEIFFFGLLSNKPRQNNYINASIITHLFKSVVQRPSRANPRYDCLAAARPIVSPLRAHCQVDNDCLAAARPGCRATARPFSSR